MPERDEVEWDPPSESDGDSEGEGGGEPPEVAAARAELREARAQYQREFRERVGTWLGNGDIAVRETVTDGLDGAVDAFLGLFEGDNLGKMLVRLGDDPDVTVTSR